MNQIIIQWETTKEPHVQGTFAYEGTDIQGAMLEWGQTIWTKHPGATIMMLYHSRYQQRLFPPALPAAPAVLETNLSALVAIINLFHHLHYLFADDENLENPNEIATTFSRLATQFDKIREGTKIQ